MTDDLQFKATLDVTAESGDHVTRFAIAHLRERGYYVADPGVSWERTSVFCKRVGIFPHRIREIIERYEQRGGPPIRADRRGKSQRIMALQSNPTFDNFCRSNSRGPRKS